MSSLVLATAGYDHTIRFWEATTGICWRTIPHNDSHVNKLEISQDKRWLAAAGNPSVKVYDIQSNTNSPYFTFTGHSGNVSAIGFNKEGRWLYSGMPQLMSACTALTARPLYAPHLKLTAESVDARLHPPLVHCEPTELTPWPGVC